MNHNTASISTLPILSVNFVGTLGFSIVLPFLVFLVTKWGGNAIVYGALAATYSFFQLIGAPILGRWSDRYGRRRILLLSQLGTLASWLVFLLAFMLPVSALVEVESDYLGEFTLTLPLLVLFLARATDGLTGGNISVANAYLADISDDEHRTENFGRMAISTNVGFVAGPAIAGVLGATALGEILPVTAALLISIIASFLIAFGLKESRPAAIVTDPQDPNACSVYGQEIKECYRREGCDRITLSDVLKLPQIAALLSINFLVMLGFSFFYIAFPTHAATELEWEVTDTGTFFSVLSLAMVLVQGPVLSRLAVRVNESVLIAGGTVILSIGFALFMSSNTGLIYTAAVVMALGNGIMWPTFMSVLSKRADGAMQGRIQGLASSLGAIASIAGLLAGGLLYTVYGTAVFALSALSIAAVLLVSIGSGVCWPGVKAAFSSDRR